MTNETFNRIMNMIEETDLSDIIEKEKEKRLNGVTRVAKTSYFNWLTREFICKFEHNTYDSEFFLYHSKDFSTLDIRNERDLEYFDSFLSFVANTQRVMEYHNDMGGCEEYEYVFKYDNNFFQYRTIVGQGSLLTIRKIEKPDFSYIDIDKFFEKEENNND